MIIQEKLNNIFKEVKPFTIEDLEMARRSLLTSYRELKSGVSEEQLIEKIHTDLIAFDVVYERQCNKKAKDGLCVLPHPEIVAFKNSKKVKSLIKDLEKEILSKPTIYPQR